MPADVVDDECHGDRIVRHRAGKSKAADRRDTAKRTLDDGGIRSRHATFVEAERGA
ncbi:hypothetical protein D3C83_201970 [compost metagenome]